MRRSIEEVKTELQLRSAEYEKRKSARIKSLTIGAGAAFVLMLAAIPVIKGAANSMKGSAHPDMAAAHYVSYSDDTAASGTEGAQNGATDNLKPPRDDDGAVSGGAPANSESTSLPRNANPPYYGGINGAGTIEADGHYDHESDLLDWFDEMRGEYRSYPRNEVEPQWATVVVSDESGNRRHEIMDRADAARLLDGFFELHDSAVSFEVIDTVDSNNTPNSEYRVRLIKDDIHFDVVKNSDGSYRFANVLMKPDEAQADAFDALVSEICLKYPNA